MAHALPAHFCPGYFDAALFADDALMADALIAAAMAFPVFGWPEDAFAEQAVFFRLERAIVDGFGFFHLAMGPFSYFLRRRKANLHRIKCIEFKQGNYTPFLLSKEFRAICLFVVRKVQVVPIQRGQQIAQIFLFQIGI